MRHFILPWLKTTDAGDEEVLLGLCGKWGSQLAILSLDYVKTICLLLLLITIITEYGRSSTEEGWTRWGLLFPRKCFCSACPYIVFSLTPTGRYLLPTPVAGQAWSASAETSNLVRMRNQALGQSAPSLTASLVSVLGCLLWIGYEPSCHLPRNYFKFIEFN